MPKYLLEASYIAEGLKGLIKDKASGRKAAVAQALADLGGGGAGLAASASRVVRTKITPLLTVEELDETIAKGVHYRPPGQV